MNMIRRQMEALRITIEIVEINDSRRFIIHAPLYKEKHRLVEKWYSLDFPVNRIRREAEEFIKINYL